MKAEELMIGDWVCTEHDSTPRQIDWIRTGEVGLFWNKVVTPPYLVPIPLTPEILEKNGFERAACGVGAIIYTFSIVEKILKRKVAILFCFCNITHVKKIACAFRIEGCNF